MRNPERKAKFGAVMAAAAMFLAACGASVSGNTYQDNGGVVQIEFRSGGKAYVSTGPISQQCTYTQDGNKVTLICEHDKTVFTVDDDGALNGPQGGFLGRLNKKK